MTDDGIAPGEDREDWETSRDLSAGLAVGDSISFSKTVTDADVRSFAAASGDTNPLHLDAAAAGETRFGERIVHGALLTGLIGAALARLPGTVVYLSQDVEFRAPVSVGDRPTARCEIRDRLGDDRYRLATRVDNDGETALDGEATVLIEDGSGSS